MNTNKFLSVRDVVYMGMLLAILEVSKRALDAVPNVELISFWLIMFTIFFGKRTLIASVGFTAMECFIYGISIWTLMYLYVWPILILLTDILRKRDAGRMAYCILSGVFGLCFGALCGLPNIFIAGLPAAIGWWVTGLPYDVIHAVSNFVIMLVLHQPMCRIMKRMFGGIGVEGERILK